VMNGSHIRSFVMVLALSRSCYSFASPLQKRFAVCKESVTLVRASIATETGQATGKEMNVPLYRSEGLFAVNKPLDWTSNDVVSYIRGILERDTRNRGGKTTRVGSRRNKSRIVRVGHGGTLDPLATGVLVVGVGRGTKELQTYLKGSKKYFARGEFGFETETLDKGGNVTTTAPFDHITTESLLDVIPSFKGTLQQKPPIFSAIRVKGKRLYEQALDGKTSDDIDIQPREVHVYNLELLNRQETHLPSFDLDIECGGGTYVRALVRDIAYELNSVATTTVLTRTKQGQFTLDDTLEKPDWSADNIYDAIDKFNAMRDEETG